MTAAADAAGKLSWQVSVDSTTSRAHVHATGARRDNVDLVAGEPDHHALGRSHGGWSTKTHPVVGAGHPPLPLRANQGEDEHPDHQPIGIEANAGAFSQARMVNARP